MRGTAAIRCFCLADNHYHLLLEAPSGNDLIEATGGIGSKGGLGLQQPCATGINVGKGIETNGGHEDIMIFKGIYDTHAGKKI